MKRILNLEKGQEIIIRYINDRIRFKKDISISNIDEWTTKGVITKIGRKYIEVKMYDSMLEKFEIENNYQQKTNIGSPDYKIYLSKEEILEEIKTEDVYSKIKCCFDSYKNNNKYSLEQLKRIFDIINENKRENHI